MGYSSKNNGRITDYTPDNTDDTLYIEANNPIDFNDLLEKVKNHFSSLEGLKISAENIHTRCLTYDLHDSSDYDNYLVVTQ